MRDLPSAREHTITHKLSIRDPMFASAAIGIANMMSAHFKLVAGIILRHLETPLMVRICQE